METVIWRNPFLILPAVITSARHLELPARHVLPPAPSVHFHTVSHYVPIVTFKIEFLLLPELPNLQLQVCATTPTNIKCPFNSR